MRNEHTLSYGMGLLLSAACGVASSDNAKPSRENGTARATQNDPATSSASTNAAPASNTDPVLPSAGSAAPLVTMSMLQPNGECRAGHYIGSFSGSYHSGAWFGGEDTIMFSTSDVGDRPGFEFWLEKLETPCTPGQEFCADAIVKGGKLRGFATPFEDQNDPSTEGGLGFSVRFEIDLTGELDCRQGKLRGKLENGCYDILSILYRFAGTIDGDYSRAKSAFTAGTWQVQEMQEPGADPPTMPLGGSGTWTADHKDDSSAPADTSVGLCAGETGFDTPVP